MVATLVGAAAIAVLCTALLGGIGWVLFRYFTVVEWPAEGPPPAPPTQGTKKRHLTAVSEEPSRAA